MVTADESNTEETSPAEVELSLEEHQARGARTARRVIIGILVLALVLGFLAYYNYSKSSEALNKSFTEMGEKGAIVDTEACVPIVMEWHKSCADDAIKTLCDHAIPMAMSHCLTAQDAPETRMQERQSYCEAFKWPASKSKWTHSKCKEIGISKSNGDKRDRIKACGNAFGAIENFCRHGGKGVRL